MRTIGIFYKFIFVIIVFLLSACAFPDKPTQPAYYDLGPAALTVPVAATAGRTGLGLPVLVLPDVVAISALERPAILYRLLYADAHALRAYTQAQWQAPPAQLVHQRLKARLALNHVMLSGAEAAAHNAPVLQIELGSFSQQFDSPASSQGLVQLRATVSWATPQGEKRVVQKGFMAQRPAPSADAAGGVRALAAATDALLADIDQWVQGVR